MLLDPDVLIFDEATSHLDTATEQAIQGNLREALQGKTVVVVAHRLSTICAADQICVLDAGQIVEQGTHEELLDQAGRYAQLWQAQTAKSLSQPVPSPVHADTASPSLCEAV